MKPSVFDYRRAGSLAEAFALFAESEGEGQYLAGGHSLMPSMALRLQAPGLLIDISRLPELQGISAGPEGLRIGALTPHATILSDPLVAGHAPLLAEAAVHVAHPAIRNRATFGGNLVLADPASEFPAVVRVLRAELDIVGPEGERVVNADDFFLDLYTTALEPGEILRSVRISPRRPGTAQAFGELARRKGDFAMVGAAIQVRIDEGRYQDVDICFHSVGLTPERASHAEDALRGTRPGPEAVRAAQAALDHDLAPGDDPVLPAEVRMHLARVLLGRLLARISTVHQEEAA